MNDRKNVNNPQVKAKDFPHSGFDLSYKSRADFILGRLHPVGFQYIMPGDKFSGKCDVKHTFNTLIVPEISDVNVSIHHFYVPFRSIDDTFIDGMTPTELNGMSSSWRTPTFSLRYLINLLLDGSGVRNALDPWFQAAADPSVTLNLQQGMQLFYTFMEQYEPLYYQSVLKDFSEYSMSVLPSGAVPFNRDNFLALLDAFITPWFGENSLLDVLGYQYLRRYDLVSLADSVFDDPSGFDYDAFIALFSDLPQNEYAIRAYYAIWYEHFRDKLIEKRSTNLPDWRKFGSTSILQQESDILCFLCVRVRSWSEDMFTTSKPDDISRHVFAPIMSTPTNLHVSKDVYNYEDAETANLMAGNQGFHNLQKYELSYIDPTTGAPATVSCPIPKAVNDVLNNLDSTLQLVGSYALDLRDLRMSQMAERYLKRNFYFGDEYQDRMLAHYGSKVSDNSIRRPHLIQADGSMINPTQEVASVTTSDMVAGTRTATAQDNTSGGNYQFFAEEFGIFISIMSVMPVAQYAGMSPQVLLSQMTDFPIPEFANNNDETGRVLEIAASGLDSFKLYGYLQFGHYPYAHAWRSRVDEVHGSFLSERSDYSFRRFFGMLTSNEVPKLNYQFLHCLPNLGMFENQIRLEGQGYYTADNHFYVERVLPTPVEEI